MDKTQKKAARYFEKEEEKEFQVDRIPQGDSFGSMNDTSFSHSSSSFDEARSPPKSSHRSKPGGFLGQLEPNEDHQNLLFEIIAGFISKGKVSTSPAEINVPKPMMKDLIKSLKSLVENPLTQSKMEAFLNHFLNKQCEEGNSDEAKGRLVEALITHAARKVLVKEEKMLVLKIAKKVIGFDFPVPIKKTIFISKPSTFKRFPHNLNGE